MFVYLKSGVREDTSCGLFTLRVIKSDIEVDSKGASHLLELSRHIGQTESKIAQVHQFSRIDTAVNDQTGYPSRSESCQEVVLHEFCAKGNN